MALQSLGIVATQLGGYDRNMSASPTLSAAPRYRRAYGPNSHRPVIHANNNPLFTILFTEPHTMAANDYASPPPYTDVGIHSPLSAENQGSQQLEETSSDNGPAASRESQRSNTIHLLNDEADWGKAKLGQEAIRDQAPSMEPVGFQRSNTLHLLDDEATWAEVKPVQEKVSNQTPSMGSVTGSPYASTGHDMKYVEAGDSSNGDRY